MKHLVVKLSGSKWHLALIVRANTDEQSGGREGVSLDSSQVNDFAEVSSVHLVSSMHTRATGAEHTTCTFIDISLESHALINNLNHKHHYN